MAANRLDASRVEVRDDENFIVIFRPFITLPCGKKIWAKWSGKKAFPIRVPRDKAGEN